MYRYIKLMNTVMGYSYSLYYSLNNSVCLKNVSKKLRGKRRCQLF